LYGQSAHIGAIKKICEDHKLFLIEDCAQSHFTKEDSQYVGTFGTAATFSFYPGKNLGAYGDAGAVVTNNDELASKMRMYANHGALIKHQHHMEGINSRLDTIQAAILNAKLPHILKWTEMRIKNARQYHEQLKNISGITLPETRKETVHTFHLYVIRTERRDELKKFVESKGVQTAIHYPTALPNLPAYKYLGHEPSDFPVASKYQNQILSLPMYPELTEEQISYVCNCVREFFK
jgi:dTDP-4-amino-4,6-dideoxygalactose transaminase